jgi:NAD-dependent DNA ligase
MTDIVLTEAGFAAAVDQAQAAAKSYYDTGDLLITDADYDVLLDRIAATKKAVPLGNAVRLRCLRVFVDQPVEDLPATDPCCA